jgi:hypothetical protein
MNNELQVFTYESAAVRTITRGGEPWFVLKDVCAVLDIVNQKQVADRLDDDEVGMSDIPHPQSPGKSIEAAVINESGLYNVMTATADRKIVYICSRYRADAAHTVADNICRALFACTIALSRGHAPIAPHLYLPRCLDDNYPDDRASGLAAGLALLSVCDEVWQWGATVSEGMAAELARAEELGIPVKVFNSIGIPYKDWNGVKYADLPEAQEFLKWEREQKHLTVAESPEDPDNG